VGKRSFVQQFFEQRAAQEPVPPDWVYYYNFKQKNNPCAIRLPAGKGMEFSRDMNGLIGELRSALSAAFESDEYRARRQILEQEFTDRQEKSLEGLQEKAKEGGFEMIRTPGGLVFAPVREGEVLTPDQYQALPEEERKQVQGRMEELQKELQEVLQQVPTIQREARERMKELNKDITRYAVGSLIDELQKKYAEISDIVTYLDNVEEDVIENVDELLPQDEEAAGSNPLAALMSRARGPEDPILRRYEINLLVDNSGLSGAPVIYEDNPTYQNLIGQVEHIAQMGALVTDFTLIKAGALHKANGGYLILDALKLLQQPYAWEALKRALRSRCIRLESIAQMLSLISTTSLEPEPIALNVKIALLGDRLLYYLLMQNDPDFRELFKVEADFEDDMDRSQENQMLYAQLVASMVRQFDLKPFDRGAVARVIEFASRIASDSSKLTTHLLPISEVLVEANYWADENGEGAVTAGDVEKAIQEQVFRADRIRERDHEGILDDIYKIDTSGERVGQVNGLSVLQIGDFAYGRPSRITSRVWAGKGSVIDIEREVDLGGPIHSKGVMILSGFLGARYAQKTPLALSATLAFEQSYGGVEGDSASSAELYALLSALSEVPIRQSIAVTGSVNQYGQVQAIGGVNEKIEGFFDICRARGLTGEQGVMIPASNVRHLMLREDIVQAVAQGKFAIYPIEHIDQGIELLTGTPAGAPGEDGEYPQDSINGKVLRRLEKFSAQQKEQGARAEVIPTEDGKTTGDKL
jgi:lon-related putative ATP-dependent protease